MGVATAARGHRAVISPNRHRAVIVSLDGVLADAEPMHAAVWQRLLDDFLRTRPDVPGEDHRSLTSDEYLRHLAGRSRLDGVSSWLRSRNIYLPAGNPEDPPGRFTRHGLAHRKDPYVAEHLQTQGVPIFEDCAALLRTLRRRKIPVAVISGGGNAELILKAADLADLVDVHVFDEPDLSPPGNGRIPGTPDPARLREAARRLGVPVGAVVTVHHDRAGVQAGRYAGAGLVVGVPRGEDPEVLFAAGADVVVPDLSYVTVRSGRSGGERPVPRLSDLPDALASWTTKIAPWFAGRRVGVFCDFDGTLSPIAGHPDAAVLPHGTRWVLARLARRVPVAVISGRNLTDVRARVGLSSLWYAGGHGFELSGPRGEYEVFPGAEEARPALGRAASELRDRLATVPGVYLEPKRFSYSVHYRGVPASRVDEVTETVAEVATRHPELTLLHGRMLRELRPALGWNKGTALRWLLDRTAMGPSIFPIYAGDDLSDEDALHEIADQGLGVVVRSQEHGDRPTAAHLAVDDPNGMCNLLRRLADLLEHQARPR